MSLLPSIVVLGLAAIAALSLTLRRESPAANSAACRAAAKALAIATGIWIASIPGLQAARSWAFFAAWFLAIAGMLNGVLHPLLALAAGGYFPGLASSVFVAIACFLLGRRLYEATQPSNTDRG